MAKKGLLHRGGKALWILVGGALVMIFEIEKAIEKYLLKVFSLLSGVVEVLVGEKAIGPLGLYTFFGLSLLLTGFITLHLDVVSQSQGIGMVVMGFIICVRGLLLLALASPADGPRP